MSQAPPKKKSFLKRFLGTTFLLFLAGGAWIYWQRNVDLHRDYGATRLEKPTHNGWDIYQQAEAAIVRAPVDPILDVKAPRDHALWEAKYPPGPRIDWMNRHAKAWAIFEDALKAKVEFPMDRWEAGESDTTGTYRFRFLARYKSVQSHAFRDQKQYGSALNAALDAIQMGHALQRTGPDEVLLEGRADDAIGRRAANDTLPYLNATDSREGARRLESIITSGATHADSIAIAKWYHASQMIKPPKVDSSLESVVPGSTNISRVNFLLFRPRAIVNEYLSAMGSEEQNSSQPWTQYQKGSVDPSSFKDPQIAEIVNVTRRGRYYVERATAGDRLLLITLALRAHLFDHHSYPENLQDLVPTYIQQLPLDPFSGKDFGYRKLGQNFVLWSVGPDGKDDNGQPIQSAPTLFSTNKNSVRADSLGDIVAGIND